MKTFMQYIEGIFDTQVHQNPLNFNDFIERMYIKFSAFPKNLLGPYIKAKLDGNDDKAGTYRVDLMVAGKSYALLVALDKEIEKEKQERKLEINWWNDPSQVRTKFGNK